MGVDSMIATNLARRPIGSVTAGVVVGKQLIWNKSYGDADMEKKVPADADTVYRIGSITKMFTALLLEQLVEAGNLSTFCRSELTSSSSYGLERLVHETEP